MKIRTSLQRWKELFLRVKSIIPRGIDKHKLSNEMRPFKCSTPVEKVSPDFRPEQSSIKLGEHATGAMREDFNFAKTSSPVRRRLELTGPGRFQLRPDIIEESIEDASAKTILLTNKAMLVLPLFIVLIVGMTGE